MPDEIIKQEEMKNFGSALVKKAEEKLKEAQRKKYQDSFDTVIRCLHESEENLQISTLAVAHFGAQKAALEAREFTFHPISKYIVYNDPKLNKSYQE